MPAVLVIDGDIIRTITSTSVSSEHHYLYIIRRREEGVMLSGGIGR